MALPLLASEDARYPAPAIPCLPMAAVHINARQLEPRLRPIKVLAAAVRLVQCQPASVVQMYDAGLTKRLLVSMLILGSTFVTPGESHRCRIFNSCGSYDDLRNNLKIQQPWITAGRMPSSHSALRQPGR